MHIAVDLDDSALDTMRSLILFHNKIYGTKLKKKDFFSCWYREVWGGTQEEEARKVEEFTHSDYFDKIIPMPGAPENLRLLVEDGHQLSVITGRVYSLTEKTEKCVEKYFSNVFSGIYHTNSYGLTGVKIKKSDVCKKEKVDLIIDDDPYHVRDCVDARIATLVHGNPWNLVPIYGSIRLKNWNEILKVIRILSSV
jgi:phosphoserine phosphatase